MVVHAKIDHINSVDSIDEKISIAINMMKNTHDPITNENYTWTCDDMIKVLQEVDENSENIIHTHNYYVAKFPNAYNILGVYYKDDYFILMLEITDKHCQTIILTEDEVKPVLYNMIMTGMSNTNGEFVNI
jgi:hypothetical protein